MESQSAPPFSSAIEHLFAELEVVDVALRRQVLRLRATNQLTDDEFRGLYIPDAQVDALLGLGLADADEPAGAVALTVYLDELLARNRARVSASGALGVDLPLPRLASLFELSRLQVQLLLVATAAEVDLRFETLFAYVQNDATKRRPTVDLALKLFSSTPAERVAAQPLISSRSSLIRWDLVQLVADPQEREGPMLSRVLKADRHVVAFLLGDYSVDERLLGFTELISGTPIGDSVPPSNSLSGPLISAASRLAGQPGLLVLVGSDSSSQLAAATTVSQALRLPLLAVDLELAATFTPDKQIPFDLIAREAHMQRSAVFLSHLDTLLDDQDSSRRSIVSLVRSLTDPGLTVMLGSQEVWQGERLPENAFLLSFDIAPPTFEAQLSTWRAALGEGAAEVDAELPALVAKFKLGTSQIHAAARSALAASTSRPANRLTLEDLHAAARLQSNQGLRRLANKVDLVYKWDDIVLPGQSLQQLAEICASVRHRHLVYSEWGFERKLALGRGVNILFAGPSGTGKTMAAAVLARELELDLYRIDLSSVVDKYIGQTEKNLNLIFKEAQTSNAILFFDEADALFGKRSEVTDAHDRYANIEVAYLLQKMEDYDGIVILASNLSHNIDEAFTRRMQHTMQFPSPDAVQREQIWNGVFPDTAPLATNVDLGFLARQFELVGGSIRNVALTAAFLAAKEQGEITMERLAVATARELQKLGRLPSQSQFREYYGLVRDLR